MQDGQRLALQSGAILVAAQDGKQLGEQGGGDGHDLRCMRGGRNRQGGSAEGGRGARGQGGGGLATGQQRRLGTRG